jgi:hypothetical protein
MADDCSTKFRLLDKRPIDLGDLTGKDAKINNKLDDLVDCISKSGFYKRKIIISGVTMKEVDLSIPNKITLLDDTKDFSPICVRKEGIILDEIIKTFNNNKSLEDESMDECIYCKFFHEKKLLDDSDICYKCDLKEDPKKLYFNKVFGYQINERDISDYFIIPDLEDNYINILNLISAKHDKKGIIGTVFDIFCKQTWLDLIYLSKALFSRSELDKIYYLTYNGIFQRTNHFNLNISQIKSPLQIFVDQNLDYIKGTLDWDNLDERYKNKKISECNVYSFPSRGLADNVLYNYFTYNSDTNMGLSYFNNTDFGYEGILAFAKLNEKFIPEIFSDMILSLINTLSTIPKMNLKFVNFIKDDILGFIFYEGSNGIWRCNESEIDADLLDLFKKDQRDAKNILQNLAKINKFFELTDLMDLIVCECSDSDKHNILLEIFKKDKFFADNLLTVDPKSLKREYGLMLREYMKFKKHVVKVNSTDKNNFIFLLNPYCFDVKKDMYQIGNLIDGKCSNTENTLYINASEFIKKNGIFIKYYENVKKDFFKEYYNKKLNTIDPMTTRIDLSSYDFSIHELLEDKELYKSKDLQTFKKIHEFLAEKYNANQILLENSFDLIQFLKENRHKISNYNIVLNYDLHINNFNQITNDIHELFDGSNFDLYLVNILHAINYDNSEIIEKRTIFNDINKLLKTGVFLNNPENIIKNVINIRDLEENAGVKINYCKDIINITKFSNIHDIFRDFKIKKRFKYQYDHLIRNLSNNINEINLVNEIIPDLYKLNRESVMEKDFKETLFEGDSDQNLGQISSSKNFMLKPFKEGEKKDKLQDYKNKITDFINEDVMSISTVRGNIINFIISSFNIMRDEFIKNFNKNSDIKLDNEDIKIMLKGNSNFRLIIKKYTNNIINKLHYNKTLKQKYKKTYDYLKYLNVIDFDVDPNNIFSLSDIDFTILYNTEKFYDQIKTKLIAIEENKAKASVKPIGKQAGKPSGKPFDEKKTIEEVNKIMDEMNYIKNNLGKISTIILYFLRYLITEQGELFPIFRNFENVCDKLKVIFEKSFTTSATSNYDLDEIQILGIPINKKNNIDDKNNCEINVIIQQNLNKKNYAVSSRDKNNKVNFDYFIQDNYKNNKLLFSNKVNWNEFNVFTDKIQNIESNYFISVNKNLDIAKGLIDRSFELFRLRLNSNFIFKSKVDEKDKVKLNIPGEIIDISIPKFCNHHQRLYFKHKEIFNEKLNYKTDENNLDIDVFSISYLIDDLEVIFFQDNFNIWNDKKFNKRVRRYFYSILIKFIQSYLNPDIFIKEEDIRCKEIDAIYTRTTPISDKKKYVIDEFNKQCLLFKSVLNQIDMKKDSDSFNKLIIDPEINDANIFNKFIRFLYSRTEFYRVFQKYICKGTNIDEFNKYFAIFKSDAVTFKVDITDESYVNEEYIDDMKNNMELLVEELKDNLIILIENIEEISNAINELGSITVDEKIKLWG